VLLAWKLSSFTLTDHPHPFATQPGSKLLLKVSEASKGTAIGARSSGHGQALLKCGAPITVYTELGLQETESEAPGFSTASNNICNNRRGLLEPEFP
jgi:hypothetical protein